MRLASIAVLAAPLALITVPQTAAAAANVGLTYDEAGFIGAQPIVTTEDFERFPAPTEYPPTQRRVVVQSVRYRSIENTSPSWAIDQDPGSPAPADNVLLRRFNSGAGAVGTLRAAIAFRDGGSVVAVGFRLEPFATTNAFKLIVTEADGDVTSMALPRDIGDTYIGLSSPDRITRVVVTQQPEVTGSVVNFALDDVSRGAISAR